MYRKFHHHGKQTKLVPNSVSLRNQWSKFTIFLGAVICFISFTTFKYNQGKNSDRLKSPTFFEQFLTPWLYKSSEHLFTREQLQTNVTVPTRVSQSTQTKNVSTGNVFSTSKLQETHPLPWKTQRKKLFKDVQEINEIHSCQNGSWKHRNTIQKYYQASEFIKRNQFLTGKGLTLEIRHSSSSKSLKGISISATLKLAYPC